ncbi:MAG: sensor histidine kinase KdpD, partial [Thermicanus sp.]|nr:sensor histidine kinase KdpD [Thermicanus sp.]
MEEEERRLNPDELLTTLKQEEKGRLTIFLGAAAGVGKTYAMLKVAQERIAEGVDVVVGYVEPHERPETMALLQGLPQIPPREIEYKGHRLKEMDLEAILKRKPTVVLVDELAHSNVPGSRHLKRYQDVEELLEAGIDVYATLNIQHVESFNDIIAQITGVQVQETVPDTFLSQARIQLIDIPTEELIRRFQEGKVYVPQQARKALTKFFRPGNINALRELAMRYAAQRVDHEMESYMHSHGIVGPWQAGERVMVCIGTSPFGEKLIRFGHRIATGMKGELLAVFVDTPRVSLKPEDREQLAKSLHLAQQLGGETLCISGDDVAEELLAVARKRNVTQIIIGKPEKKLRLRDRFGGSIVDQIVRRSQNISVHVIPGDRVKAKEDPAPYLPNKKENKGSHLLPYAEITVIMLLLTAGSWLIKEYLGLVNLSMLYLLPVLYAAVRWGERMGIFSALLAVLFFDFFA